MYQDDIMNIISSISIGTFVSWVIVISSLVSLIGAGFIKLYKLFEKAQNVKEENDYLKKMVESDHDKLNIISAQLQDISNKLDKNEEATLKSLRHTIVTAAEKQLWTEV